MTSPLPLWPAPTPHHRPLSATIEVPGSKSLTNRHFILAALADSPGIIRGALNSRDADLMRTALEKLGAHFTAGTTPGDWHITPITGDGSATIHCGLAGTVMRFIPAVAALRTGTITLDGDPGARIRPMGPIVSGLRQAGVTIDSSPGDFLPITITGTGTIPGGTVTLDASASSQFVSGLLLAAARSEHGLTVTHNGTTLPSVPHIDMTIDVLRAAGVRVDTNQPWTWTVHPGPINSQDIRIEPDLSNAGPFLAAALIVGGSVHVPHWPSTTTQAGAMMIDVLTSMGAQANLANGTMTVTGTGTMKGIDIDLSAAGELAPSITAVAALATTPSQLRGIGHLRGHETDRLAALVTEINNLGGNVTETSDGLIIKPQPLHGGTFHTYHDHRMAHAGALLGLKVPGIYIEDIATTTKTLPDFPGMWATLLHTQPTTPSDRA